ncbi:hypothetical protein X975_23673, partial [Stegodyphus mimosarum]
MATLKVAVRLCLLSYNFKDSWLGTGSMASCTFSHVTKPLKRTFSSLCILSVIVL